MATTTLSFRLATHDDVARLEALINAAFRADNTTQVFLTSERIDVTSAQEIIDRLAIPESGLLVGADESGLLLATCGVRKVDENKAWLAMLAVDPMFHSTGLGRQMLEYAEDYTRKRWGSKRMEMDVVSARTELVAWYHRRGYQMTGESKPFPYGSKHDGVLREGLEFAFIGKDLDVTAADPVAE
ncbi:acyl-CoA N-acyltransferase [Thozetella sp. PMI_491]|nr:acyl-CoA N-acyltransferase [Thozetella sp. PMI_491]